MHSSIQCSNTPQSFMINSESNKVGGTNKDMWCSLDSKPKPEFLTICAPRFMILQSINFHENPKSNLEGKTDWHIDWNVYTSALFAG